MQNDNGAGRFVEAHHPAAILSKCDACAWNLTWPGLAAQLKH